MNKYIIIITGIVLTAAACSQGKVEETTPSSGSGNVAFADHQVMLTNRQVKDNDIALLAPAQERMSKERNLKGRIQVPPKSKAMVSLPIQGNVTEVLVHDGNYVKKGELMAKVQSMEFLQLQQDYLQTRSDLQFLEKELARQKKLNAEDAGMKKALEETQSKYNAAKSNLNAMGGKLEMLGVSAGQLSAENVRKDISIRAPIRGNIYNLNIFIGSNVDPNTAMLEIIDVQDFHLELMAYNGVGEQFEIGQQVLWTPGRQDDQRYKAEVFALSPQVDEANNSYQVFCEPVDRDIPGIRPGMFVTAFIQTAADAGTVLPSAAIVEYEGDNWVYTATQSDSGYVFHPAKVEVLLERDNKVLVNLPELPAKGTQLVGKGVYYVHSALQNKLFGE